MTGSLDGQHNIALMLGAVTGDSPRYDLAPLRDKITESLHILVTDPEGAVRTKPAHLSACKKFLFSGLHFSLRHDYPLNMEKMDILSFQPSAILSRLRLFIKMILRPLLLHGLIRRKRLILQV